MRILFATNHGYPPQQWGGSESSTHDLCVTLGELGHEPAVLCRLRRRPAVSRESPIDEGRGGSASLGAASGGPARAYRVLRDRHPAGAVGRAVRLFAPDVAVIQAGRPLELAARFAGLGVPTVVYVRDALFDDLGGEVGALPGLRYVTTSRWLADRFAAAFGVAPPAIPPVVRPDAYRVDSRRRNVTFVCPHPRKGVHLALALAAGRPDVPFVFVESWPVHPLRRVWLAAKRLGLRNVTLRPPAADVRDVYQDTRLLLVPSRWPEGWGRVVSEAQVSGVPVLASDRGGLPEAVGEGGRTVPADAGTNAWLDAFSQVWDDPAEYERLAAAALRHAARPEFAPRVLAARLLEVLEDAVLGRSSAAAPTPRGADPHVGSAAGAPEATTARER